MARVVYLHPFSSYAQKVLIALYEVEAAFTPRLLTPDNPDAGAELAVLSPLGKFPVLVENDGRAILESSAIIEHLHLAHPSHGLVPADPAAAVHVRMMDRLFDNYVMTPMQKLVGDRLRPEDARDPYGVAEAKDTLARMYAWLNERVMDAWAAGDQFSLADCAAAPALFYADWAEPIPNRHTALLAYADRLMARPSVARAIEGARDFRPFFPLGGAPRW